MNNPVPTVSKSDARTDQYRGSFDQGANMQKGSGVSPQKLPRTENKTGNEWQPTPLVKGGQERHYDDASTRPSIPVSSI